MSQILFLFILAVPLSDQDLSKNSVIVESKDSGPVEISKDEVRSKFYQFRLENEFRILAQVKWSPEKTVISNPLFFDYADGGILKFPISFYRETNGFKPGWKWEQVARSICKALGFEKTLEAVYDENKMLKQSARYQKFAEWSNAKKAVVLHDSLRFNYLIEVEELTWNAPEDELAYAKDGTKFFRNFKQEAAQILVQVSCGSK
jgi:hypothetical protein